MAAYATYVNKFTGAGGHLYVYVPTGYVGRHTASYSGCYPTTKKKQYEPTDVAACANRYLNLYGTIKIDGVFIDEMGPDTSLGDTDAAAIKFYSEVYRLIKLDHREWKIIGNAGQPVSASYFNNSAGNPATADTIVTFEGDASSFGPNQISSSFQATRYASLLYATAAKYDVKSLMKTSQARNVSYFYATNDGLKKTNPWDTLPKDWKAQIVAAKAVNLGK